MTEIEKALIQITEIHQSLARTEVYRGYRAIPLALTGVCGILAATFQDRFLDGRRVEWFVYYWAATAAIGFSITLCGALAHLLREPSAMRRHHTMHVVGQFMPCVVAGACLTLAMIRIGEPGIRFLPGCWAILYSLGAFASRPYLPSAMGWAAGGFMVAGIVMLHLVERDLGLSPWGMGITFGGGHLAIAVILYFSLEREVINHDE